MRNALLPVPDLRGPEPKYTFIRAKIGGTGQIALPRTWQNKHYYKSIPGTGTSGLVQNPHY